MRSRPTRGEHPRRSPALDGFRGLAILLTMLGHFIGQREMPSDVARVTRVGWIGVELFFALSGFLITRILLESRGTPDYYRAFYARRTRRILPAFALFMFVLLVVAVGMPSLDPVASANFLRWQPWFWLFAANWLVVFRVRHLALLPLSTGALWSLAIEEQFYLVWPWVVAHATTRTLTRILWGAFVFSFLARFALIQAAPTHSQIYVFTPGRLDGLAAGALVALWARGRGDQRTAPRFANAPAVVWLALGALTVLTLRTFEPDGQPMSGLAQLFAYPVVAAASALVIAGIISAPPTAPVTRLFSPQWLRTLGKYSYALYLWQTPVNLTLAHYGIVPHAVGEAPFFALATALTFAAALASWHLVEVRALRARSP